LTLAFRKATTTIPIVVLMPDPLAYGVVPNLAHPGGNITGVSVDAGLEIWSKRLELLKDVVPNISRVAFFASEDVWKSPFMPVFQKAVQNANLSLIGPALAAPFDEGEYRRTFWAMKQNGADAVILSDQPEFIASGPLIVELAQEARLPTISARRSHAELGCLIGYGWDTSELYARAAADIDQILKGAKPGDIPFYQASRFVLVINLRTAKALSITVPASLLAQADEVVE
jgi:putative tryptophan/tyrosine transport system substrate-binding protein